MAARMGPGRVQTMHQSLYHLVAKAEQTGRAVKTHRNVNGGLHRLTKGDPRLDTELRAFLGRTCNLKAIADYETGPGSEVPPEQATDAIEASKRFVAKMAELIEAP